MTDIVVLSATSGASVKTLAYLTVASHLARMIIDFDGWVWPPFHLPIESAINFVDQSSLVNLCLFKGDY